ncbi:hypothetical protein ACXWO0_10305, partial [Streptococcus pyogenes]
VVGTAYTAVVRDGFMSQFLQTAHQPPASAQVLARLRAVRQQHDAMLRTAEPAQRFEDALQRLAAFPAGPLQAEDSREHGRLRSA